MQFIVPLYCILEHDNIGSLTHSDSCLTLFWALEVARGSVTYVSVSLTEDNTCGRCYLWLEYNLCSVYLQSLSLVRLLRNKTGDATLWDRIKQTPILAITLTGNNNKEHWLKLMTENRQKENKKVCKKTKSRRWSVSAITVTVWALTPGVSFWIIVWRSEAKFEENWRNIGSGVGRAWNINYY